ncbi:Hypothetical predicted protein [Paramuricea clavata]|uniref:Uncharacterized protein n=1 Tax=Paramuricea clavata TaxID=317549 RepID=A0A7D9L237_PARCT|nr:Hypothetical predicted protein [Paramuricea clavata]
MDPGVSLVAKVLEASENTKVWQITFSSSEILIFKDIDADGGRQKKLLKIAKYLKTKSDLPDTVASYHLKTLLLEMNERRKDPADWTEDKLVPQFKELMNGFLAALKAGILKSFFITKFNLFRGKNLAEAITKVSKRSGVTLIHSSQSRSVTRRLSQAETR